MIIHQKRVHLNSFANKPNKFIVERVCVPKGLSGLRVKLLAETQLLDCLLVYDTTYNLRAEIGQVTGLDIIVIHEDAMQTSDQAKPGHIPSGEWVIAFEITPNCQKINLNFSYMIEGIKEDAIANY